MIQNLLIDCLGKPSNKISLQVVLVANSLPALNDATAMELPEIVAEAAKVCGTSSL